MTSELGLDARPTVSVVIPCYRSSVTLPPLLERLNPVLAESAARSEVILIVDGSPDDTWQVARALSASHDWVKAIRLSRNFGQHNALLAGIRAASCDVVVTIDDDLQHRPEDIADMLDALADDVDLVYGVHRGAQNGALRGVGSRLGRELLAHGLGVPFAREISAFRAFRTRLRDGFAALDGPHISIDVALSWTTTHVRAIEVTVDPRREGRSGYTTRALVSQLLRLVLGYSTLPLRLVSFLGALCAALGFSLLVYVLTAYAVGYTQVPGFTFLASMVAMFSGAQMLAIGVVGEYVARVYVRSTGRPAYVITRDGM
jgi:glycosyltransferase involved in cell wall biosynthesis